MGGEVWTILRNEGRFSEPTAQFIIGCVLEAFEYLHERGIVCKFFREFSKQVKSLIKAPDFNLLKSCKILKLIS